MPHHTCFIALLLSVFLNLAFAQSSLAKVVLPSLFSDGMVIQRDRPICIWGKASPHEHVQVQIDAEVKAIIADANGDWQTNFSPLSPGKERTLTVQAANKIVLSRVKVGDVYLCSGQSNMAFPLGASDVTDDDISQLDKLQLAIYTTPNQTSASEIFDPHGAWRPITTATVKSFPAIPYQFGRALSISQKIPVGIISASCCGACLESFLPPETVKRMHCENVPFVRAGTVSNNFRTLLYPFLKMSLRGIVWYQGETNMLNIPQYRTEFPAFITDIRKRMKDQNLAFFFVQLPSFGYRQEELSDSFWANMREAQTAALALPNVHMVVSLDTTNAGSAREVVSLHPKEKRAIALRLARLAREEASGKGAVKALLLQKVEIDGDAITVKFNGVTHSLSTSDGQTPRGFVMAGPDHKFYPAQATLHGDSIKITSDDVVDPQAARYAFSDNPDCNVVSDGLPLPPFRTDKWATNPKLNPAARESQSMATN